MNEREKYKADWGHDACEQCDLGPGCAETALPIIIAGAFGLIVGVGAGFAMAFKIYFG